jgi:hypothetical protein
MFKKTEDKNTKTIESKKKALNFETQWTILQDGIQQLFDFIDSDHKKPYNYKEWSNMYQ